MFYGRRMDENRLITSVCDVVSVPKEAPADSFVLHAPLEVLARVLLLPLVRPSAAAQARARLEWVAAKYERAGAPLADRGEADVASVDVAVPRFVAALAAGELDDVDRLARWLGAHASAPELQRALAGPTAASLAAAAHGSILLYLLP